MTAADDREVTTAPTAETCALCGADRTTVALALSSKSGFKRYVCASPSGCRRRREQAAALDAAEARGVERGYRRAVDRLRDGDCRQSWLNAQPDGVTLMSINGVIAYLEAVDQDADSARHSTPQTAQPRVWVLPSIPEDVKAVTNRVGMRLDRVNADHWDDPAGHMITEAELVSEWGPITEVPDA